MPYCPSCFAEYRPEVASCPECKVAVVPLAELEKLPEFQRTKGVPTDRFVRVTTVDDPFDCESLCDALEVSGIPALARAKRASLMDVATSPMTHDWWEIMVPELYVAKATPVLEQRRRDLREAEAEAEQAAVTEEIETEKP